MAPAVVSVPLPLLYDSLLASSWTWLALSLATIATLLRALSRICFCRHRPQALLPPCPSSFSAGKEQISSFITDLSRPLQKSHKHRSGCKSTPSLRTLLQSHDGLGELGFLCWLHNPNSTSQCLRKVASTSKIWNGQLLCGRTDSADGALKARTFDFTLGAGFRVGLIVNSQDRVSGASSPGFEERDGDVHCLRAPDVLPSCKSPEKSTLHSSFTPSYAPLCFETQFGWRQMLEMKLGLQWQAKRCALSLKHAALNGSVVKLWSCHEKNLFKALNVKGTSIGALAVDTAGGSACIAMTNGDVSHWDIMNQARLSRVSSDVDSVFSALCWREESRFAIAGGGGNVIKLWDSRSPNLVPILKWNANSDPYQSLQCEGNTLYIYQGNGDRLCCDLRKTQVGCFSNTRIAPPLVVSPQVEAERLFARWEKLLCSEEESSWDEPILDMPQKGSHSFTSRCATLVRSLSSSSR